MEEERVGRSLWSLRKTQPRLRRAGDLGFGNQPALRPASWPARFLTLVGAREGPGPSADWRFQQ